MTLVKSLYSGDPDVIQTRGLKMPDYSGVNDLQGPDFRYLFRDEGLIRGKRLAFI